MAIPSESQAMRISGKKIEIIHSKNRGQTPMGPNNNEEFYTSLKKKGPND